MNRRAAAALALGCIARESRRAHQAMRTVKTSEDYRLLAERIREAARKLSTEKERASLLSVAKKWDLVADYLQLHPRNSTG
jgi:hypothetical protein